jgi:murein DD-endopeptidase MepM/ murein hydrolase activator NlpD
MVRSLSWNLMKRRRVHPRRRLVPLLIGCFFAGGMADWWVRTHLLIQPSPTADTSGSAATVPAARIGPPLERSHDEARDRERNDIVVDAVEELRHRDLRLPIDAAIVEGMRGQFEQSRGRRTHKAADILAPRHTPVRAVEDGTIAKLLLNKAGGTTIYQFDRDERFCYYYAHLDRYVGGLREGQHVARGEVLGYVGTSGNAPANTPHLHFAIFELTSAKRWWQGRAIDPYAVFSMNLRDAAFAVFPRTAGTL